MSSQACRENDRSGTGRFFLQHHLGIETAHPPSVRNNHWQRVAVARANMNKVDFHPVNFGHELRQGIELCLRLAPIIAGAPVLNQRLQIRQLRTLRAVSNSFLARPTGRLQAPAQVGQSGVGEMNLEGTNGGLRSRCGQGRW
jgi:hypothetical protein